MKAIAVVCLQMLVPLCVLQAEFRTGLDVGPAEGDLGFRLIGFTLYGYACFSMYHGAKDGCRTELLNVMFENYDNVPMGYWVPLVAGEISNLFTAAVLIIALYSIFTTQTQPADLILNAVAINFLGDCDAGFVDKNMRMEAIKSFKDLSFTLFSHHQVIRRSSQMTPVQETMAAKAVRIALEAVAISGVIGCICFLVWPVHNGGIRDQLPGAAHHAVYVNTTSDSE